MVVSSVWPGKLSPRPTLYVDTADMGIQGAVRNSVNEGEKSAIGEFKLKGGKKAIVSQDRQ